MHHFPEFGKSEDRGGVGWVDGVGLGLVEDDHGLGCYQMRVGPAKSVQRISEYINIYYSKVHYLSCTRRQCIQLNLIIWIGETGIFYTVLESFSAQKDPRQQFGSCSLLMRSRDLLRAGEVYI